MQISTPKIIIVLFSLALFAFGFNVFAQESSTPQIKSFFASPQSRYYLGDADQDGAPDFAVGKVMEFELSVCDEKLAVRGELVFGDGAELAFEPAGCGTRVFPHVYPEIKQDVVVLLDVKNEAGRSALSAIKVDIVPLPPTEESAESAPVSPPTRPSSSAPPALEPPTSDSAADQPPPPPVAQTKVNNLAQETKAPLEAQSSKVTETFVSSPLLGAFVTGVLGLFFIVILIYAIRTFFNRP